MHSKYYIPARSAVAPYTVDVTPESAGWTESSLQVVDWSCRFRRLRWRPATTR